ncbi:MAG: ATP-binding cassette domain-containing protein [Chthoniobacterales bacterium]
MLTVNQLSKSYHGRVLFEEASIQIVAGERLGLIGANGAGKTTFFSIILGDNEADAGSVELQRGTRLGYLPQESAPTGSETILQLASSVDAEMKEIYRQMRESEEDSDDFHEAYARFSECGGHAFEIKAKRILAGLAFREEDLNREARQLSGGWIMRAHLARLLVMEPDLLMLDEPTNHLDLESLGWFQNYLKNYPGAILVISHDRAFLNAICRGILEIRHKKLHRYQGDFDTYVEQRKAREEQHLAAWRNQQREIAHLQSFIDRFRAKASKAAQAQERIKRLEKMERIEPPDLSDARVKFHFPQPERSGHRVLRLHAVSQSYGEMQVYENLNFVLERGDRIVLVGPNGAGKSTLLKICAGLVPISSGEREEGHKTKIGYFAQQRTEQLDVQRTVLEEALAMPNPVSEQSARTLLGAFLFRGDDVFKQVGVLSGGEKSRLALVKLLLDPPNLLLLDEPTTHLDMSSIDALVDALSQYQGTLMFVSHDVYFIRSLAQAVVHVHSGTLTRYSGDYDYYLEKIHAASEVEALVTKLENHQPELEAKTERAPKKKMGLKEIRAQRKAEAEQRKEENRQKRERENRIAEMEKEISRLEALQSDLAKELENPDLGAEPARALEVHRKLTAVTQTLEETTEEWEELMSASASP